MSDTPPPKPPKPSKATESSPMAASAPAGGPANDESIVGYNTEAFLPSDKSHRDLDAILAADAEDESLRRYKEALLGSAAHGDRGDISDPRRLVITEYRVIFAPEENLPDIVHHLATNEGLQKLASEGITLKEGVKFKFRINFKVQHDLLIGVKFVNKLSKLLFSETEELVLGSYPPSSQEQAFEFPKWDYNEAPKGMLYRGEYKATNSFVDTDGKIHLRMEYNVHIIKA